MFDRDRGLRLLDERAASGGDGEVGFAVVLDAGRQFEVEHGEALAVGRAGVELKLGGDGDAFDGPPRDRVRRADARAKRRAAARLARRDDAHLEKIGRHLGERDDAFEGGDPVGWRRGRDAVAEPVPGELFLLGFEQLGEGELERHVERVRAAPDLYVG